MRNDSRFGIYAKIAKLKISARRGNDVIERFLAWAKKSNIIFFQEEAYMEGSVLGVFIGSEDVDKVRAWLEAQDDLEEDENMW